MRKLFLLAGLILLFSTAVMAQDHPKGEFFAGYSYARINPGGGLNGFNLNGWNASIAGNVNNWFGVAGDFSGHYGSPRILGVKVNTTAYTYTFGPRISYRKNEKVTPFAHVLLGGVHIKGSTLGTNVSDNGFAMYLGGGFDVKANEHIAIRVAQADYLLTHVSGDNNHHFRYSGGIVIRFGK